MSENGFMAVKDVPDKVVIVDMLGNPLDLAGGLTDAELRASPLSVVGPLTNAELRAVALAISAASLPLPAGAATQATLATLLTDAQLRAAAVAISAASLPLPAGAATSANQATEITAINTLLTNAQLRASAVPVSQASQPLPTGAATEATLLTRATSQNITDLATALINAAYNLIAAQVIPVATTTFNVAVNPAFPHTFLSVIPCNSSGVYTASATGSATITVESVNSPGVTQTPAEATISMAAPADVSFGGNLLSVRGTVTGLTSTHYRVGISQNKT